MSELSENSIIINWMPRPRNYISEKRRLKSKLITTINHPLLLKPILYPHSSTNSHNVQNKTQIKSTLNGCLDPLTAALLESETDPLSKYVSQVDSNSEFEDIKSGKENNYQDLKKKGLNETKFEPWSSKRTSILAKYTTSQELSLVTVMLSSSEKNDFVNKANTPNTLTEKVRQRLELLDDLEEGSIQETLTLTQDQYVNRINEFSNNLNDAWNRDQRVKTLKIAIQCAKLLSDTSAIQYYPSKFVLITDILDVFGRLVFERILEKAACSSPKTFFSVSNIDPTKVSDQAKETCQNWFYKIASIRELLPRIYIEACLLKSYNFLSRFDAGKSLKRLTYQINGIGDSLVAAYAHSYLARVGQEINLDELLDTNVECRESNENKKQLRENDYYLTSIANRNENVGKNTSLSGQQSNSYSVYVGDNSKSSLDPLMNESTKKKNKSLKSDITSYYDSDKNRKDCSKSIENLKKSLTSIFNSVSLQLRLEANKDHQGKRLSQEINLANNNDSHYLYNNNNKLISPNSNLLTLLNFHGIDLLQYLSLFRPALDWVIQCLVQNVQINSTKNRQNLELEMLLEWILEKFHVQNEIGKNNELKNEEKPALLEGLEPIILESILFYFPYKLLTPKAENILTYISLVPMNNTSRITFSLSKRLSNHLCDQNKTINKELIEESQKSLLLSQLSKIVENSREPVLLERRRPLLNSVWREIALFQSPTCYSECAEVWTGFVVKYFGRKEINALLGDLIPRLTQDREFEKQYGKLKGILNKILKGWNGEFFELFTLIEKFMPFIDLFFQSDSKVKAEVCTNILSHFSINQNNIEFQKNTEFFLKNPIAIHNLMTIAKGLHDTISALTTDDEVRATSKLIIDMISKIKLNDVDAQLAFYVECRTVFSNLDSVIGHIVSRVNGLSLDSCAISMDFKRACAAFCYITIPSLNGIFHRFSLYILTGSCCLQNGCLAQAEASIISTIDLIPAVPRYLEIEGKICHTEILLIDHIRNLSSILLTVPDSPNESTLYILKLLISSIEKYSWDPKRPKNYPLLLANILLLLSAYSQEVYLYGVSGIDSNDALYGGDKKFLAELNKISDSIVKSLLSKVENMGFDLLESKEDLEVSQGNRNHTSDSSDSNRYLDNLTIKENNIKNDNFCLALLEILLPHADNESAPFLLKLWQGAVKTCNKINTSTKCSYINSNIDKNTDITFIELKIYLNRLKIYARENVELIKNQGEEKYLDLGYPVAEYLFKLINNIR